jgi:hypothetical protein
VLVAGIASKYRCGSYTIWRNQTNGKEFYPAESASLVGPAVDRSQEMNIGVLP